MFQSLAGEDCGATDSQESHGSLVWEWKKISQLKMWEAYLSFRFFLPVLRQHSIFVRSDNVVLVKYIIY